MAKATMTTKKIRIRHAGGSTTLSIPSDMAVGEVAKTIASSIAIPADQQAWKGGFPPRPMKFSSSDVALPSDVDLIHVARGDPSVEFSVPENNPAKFDVDVPAEFPPLVDPEGFVVRRVMDADNSCLFNSIGYAMQRSRSHATALRKVVTDAVLSDPFAYSEAVLGRPTDEYATWISKQSSWGGQIELSILARELNAEIAAFDVIRNRHDVYGTDGNYKRRIMVIYDGIHYDALAYCFDPSLPEDMDVTHFHPNDVIVMERAQQLCQQQHNAKAFTDTSNFTLRCLICQQGLKGQAAAQLHAEATGHQNFAEFR